MRLLLLLSLALSSLSFTPNRPIKIAIVDTGADLQDPRFKDVICGAKDFTGEGIEDRLGHGTHVLGLIERFAPKAPHCFLVLKYYKGAGSSSYDNYINLQKAFKEAIAQNADIVNYSGGGVVFEEQEYLLLRDNPQVTFIVAAGNNGEDLKNHPYYPASYPLKNVIAVGALDGDKRASFSNYGERVKAWEEGVDLWSWLPHGEAGFKSGTSFATAVHTGKVLHGFH